MILAGLSQPGKPGYPWLVFLHGFSGDCREWQAVGASLHDYPRLYIDLPGHGGSADTGVTGFAEVSELLSHTLVSYNILRYWLVGYSLGGRIAMFHACQHPAGLDGVIVEGGHPGLQDADARQARLTSDRHWASRFRSEPLEDVFADWYQQPVFASLTDEQRKALIALRSRNNGPRLAEMLEATSLAVQPDLRPRSPRVIFLLTISMANVTGSLQLSPLNLTPRVMLSLTPDTTPTGTTRKRLPRVWLRYCVIEQRTRYDLS